MKIETYKNKPYKQLTYKKNNKPNQSDEQNNDIKLNDKNKNNQNNHIGSAVTIATLAAVCSIFMLSKGFQKNTGIMLNKLKDYLEKKRDLTSTKESDKWTKFYEYNLRRVSSFIKKSESINNITSAKDILFMKLMYKTKPTKKIHDSITNYFEKLSRKTVISSYEKTQKYFDQMNQIFDKLDETILKNSPDEIIYYKDKEYSKKELIALARNYRDNATTIAKNLMSKNALDCRYEYINKTTSALYSKFWDASFKDFWSKNNKFKRKEMWQTFIAAEQIKGDKTDLADIIAIGKEALSYASTDKTELIKEYVSKLDDIIPAKDSTGIEIIKKLKWFTKHPEIFTDNSKLFLDELHKLEKHEIKTPDVNITKTQKDCKQKYIFFLNNLINENKTGEIQDMLSIYYKIAPFELDKSGALLAVKKAVNFFNKSVNTEAIDFFDKVRDLRLGSAPTDVLTILFSFITLSYGLGYAKDKDARTSVMLRSGIPIIGGIATTTFTATKLVSGGKSIALGLLSGVILNQIGKIIDKKRPKFSKTEDEKSLPD